MNINYLRQSRVNKGYSQMEVARYINVTNGVVCHWEKGLKCPRADILTKLCRLLDMDANKLLDLE